MTQPNTPNEIEAIVEELALDLSYAGRGNLLDDTMGMDTVKERIRRSLTQLHTQHREEMEGMVREIQRKVSLCGMEDSFIARGIKQIAQAHGITIN